MADKTKTIKNCTDQELKELLTRLRLESDVQDLIMQLKRKSADGYVSYDQQLGISTETPIESLYHWGILGMKWGRRRGSNKPTMTKKKPNNSQDYNTAEGLKKKKLSQMSNSELRALNERMQLERSYKDLKKVNKSSGRKFVEDILSGSAKQLASTFISKYATKGIEKLIEHYSGVSVPTPTP